MLGCLSCSVLPFNFWSGKSVLLGRQKTWRKVLRFLSQGISLDERFPKPHLITPTQASGALASLSVSLAGALMAKAVLGRETAECYKCLSGKAVENLAV